MNLCSLSLPEILLFGFICSVKSLFAKGKSFNWTANPEPPNLADYFYNPPESYEPHAAIGGIQCYRRKCRLEAANLGSCPGYYDNRVRGNFCVVKYEYGYLMFDGVFSVFDVTSACFDKVKACHVSYCNTNEFYQDSNGWCRCEDRQCILRMLLQPPNFVDDGSQLYYRTNLNHFNADSGECSEFCAKREMESIVTSSNSDV